ncbi:MAG: winged helix-turn-helix domain-containing protein [Terriglobia bacterium]
MPVIGQIGETAGEVWRLLASEGPQSAAQLKKKLNPKGELLNMALGWLAREDKIELSNDKKSVLVQLKQ